MTTTPTPDFNYIRYEADPDSLNGFDPGEYVLVLRPELVHVEDGVQIQGTVEVP